MGIIHAPRDKQAIELLKLFYLGDSAALLLDYEYLISLDAQRWVVFLPCFGKVVVEDILAGSISRVKGVKRVVQLQGMVRMDGR